MHVFGPLVQHTLHDCGPCLNLHNFTLFSVTLRGCSGGDEQFHEATIHFSEAETLLHLHVILHKCQPLAVFELVERKNIFQCLFRPIVHGTQGGLGEVQC